MKKLPSNYGTITISQRRRKRNKWSKFIRVAAACFILGLIWVAYVQYKIHTAPESDSNSHADVGIVLGASVWNNEPSPGLRERLERGLTLYRNGQVGRIIVSGGLDHNGSTITEAEGMRNYLVRQGIPEQDIVLETQARSTYENVLFSRQIMIDNGWKSAVLITHSYHAARAYDIAKFLDMSDPKVSSMDSKVMWMPWHKARETLAFTKWELDKLRYTIRGKRS
jgi:uncharacterized SAM-binding protein YcdF (DUF218 family)